MTHEKPINRGKGWEGVRVARVQPVPETVRTVTRKPRVTRTVSCLKQGAQKQGMQEQGAQEQGMQEQGMWEQGTQVGAGHVGRRRGAWAGAGCVDRCRVCGWEWGVRAGVGHVGGSGVHGWADRSGFCI